MEIFEQMRREYEHGGQTIRAIAKKFQVHRRMVRQAIANAMPPARKKPGREEPALEPVKELVDSMLDQDGKAPRKQRHTAHRIWMRIREERPECRIGESTIRRYVRKRKEELGLAARETFVPQSYNWGGEAQVDWYEAWAELDGEETKLQVFSMRSMASGGAFHRAFLRATQQAFLEGHELAFRYFGGVFQVVRYDNLKSAVQKILRGHQREETTRFVGFRSHWGYESEFCNPACGNEKGGVEGEVGYFRRNHWVPVPKAHNLAELNAQLLTGCRADESRSIEGHAQSVGVGMAMEREHLLALPDEGFELAETSFATVDTKGCVKVRTNWYSAPVKAGHKVHVKVLPAYIEVWQEGQCVARHERCYEHGKQILDLEHYLDVLERKPGAFAGSTPLVQWRERGRWPASYDQIWARLKERHGKQRAARDMVDLLQLGRVQGYGRLERAIEQALELGCTDAAAVKLLVLSQTEAGDHRSARTLKNIGVLSRFERPLPVLIDYDRLLGTETVQ